MQGLHFDQDQHSVLQGNRISYIIHKFEFRVSLFQHSGKYRTVLCLSGADLVRPRGAKKLPPPPYARDYGTGESTKTD